MVRVGGPRVSHGTITVNSVRVVTVISGGGGTARTRVSGAVRGSGVCSLRFVWVEPGPWPAPVGLFDNFNVIIALSQNYFKTSLISA